MKIYLVILFAFLISCSTKEKNLIQLDEFDKILKIMKTKKTQSIYELLGKPTKIRQDDRDPGIEIWEFDKSIEIHLTKIDKKVRFASMFFFRDFDNYTYLKKRFNNYVWIEKKLKDHVGDVATDMYSVEVPDLKIYFEYDNYSPKRKVMWIGFE